MSKYLVLLWIFSYTADGGVLFGRNSQELPTPKGLKADVKFWESVFRDFGGDRCLIHDSKNPSVVFDVVKVPRRSGRRQRLAIRKGVKRVKVLLDRLAQRKRPKGKWERQVARDIPSFLRHRKYYKAASHRLRCQRGVADQFRGSLKRSKKYLGLIRREIKKLKLPMDLAFLPHLESGYNNKAQSKVGARGLWQIMPKTGRGVLTVSRKRDDRINVRKATRFALRLLKSNYKKTASWPLAVTGYNYGINGVMRAMKKYKTSDYMKIRKRHKTKIFRFAAKSFYPSFLAVRNLAAKKQRLAGM